MGPLRGQGDQMRAKSLQQNRSRGRSNGSHKNISGLNNSSKNDMMREKREQICYDQESSSIFNSENDRMISLSSGSESSYNPAADSIYDPSNDAED